MFSYQLYKVLHVGSLFLLFTSLGGHAALAMRGGDVEKSVRKLFIISHGVALMLALVGGMGLLARIGVHWMWPGWVFAKLGIWLALGGIVAAFKRAPKAAPMLFWVVPLLGATAVAIVMYRSSATLPVAKEAPAAKAPAAQP